MNTAALTASLALVRAQALSRRPSTDQARSATVTAWDAGRNVATVRCSDGGEVPVRTLTTVGTLVAGDRVRVTFQAPHGAVITGKI